MRLYLAGPLFTTAEQEFNSRLAALLRQAGYEIFLPQEHEQRDKSASEIFLSDVAGVDWADAVVANMDGPDPDSGTCWECGYAYRKKPIVLYRTDFRAAHEPGKAPYNLMLTESADRVIEVALTDTATVARRLIAALRELTNAR
ncbi:MAG TPA: nucleoside 2-deoxyribosyltransferase [Xanthobacteraceae bacterium]|nr:nucleoside 2-deoxyribosyltransferase [Xanthobacteraceae bacterium]